MSYILKRFSGSVQRMLFIRSAASFETNFGIVKSPLKIF